MIARRAHVCQLTRVMPLILRAAGRVTMPTTTRVTGGLQRPLPDLDRIAGYTGGEAGSAPVPLKARRRHRRGDRDALPAAMKHCVHIAFMALILHDSLAG